MLSKRQKPYDANALPAPKRLAANVAHLFASNTISANDFQTLANDMASASVETLPVPARPLGANVARDARRRLLKRSQWVKPYLATIRMLDRAGNEIDGDVAIDLPHEIVDMMLRYGNKKTINSTARMDPATKRLYEICCALANGDDLTGVGLHGDGVPCNWDRSESAEVLSINLPGLDGKWKGMRIPLTALPHWSIGPHTWHDLMEIVAWSFRALFDGYFPTKRHDQTDFRSDESHRKKLAGREMLGRGALVEIRGDWKFYAETFEFPRWNAKKDGGGICWSCTCKKDQARNHIIIACLPCTQTSGVQFLRVCVSYEASCVRSMSPHVC